MSSVAGLDLLLAVTAVQLGYATADQVLGCARELLRAGERRSLPSLLEARGLLSARQVSLLTAMVRKAVAAQGGEARRTLELFPGEAQALAAALLAPDAEAGGVTAPVPRSPLLDEAAELVCPEQPGQYSPVLDGGVPVELGHGGVGRVTLVYDHFLGREVALKELRRDTTGSRGTDTATSMDLEARFLREARLAGQLEHPAVVPVYELGRRADGTAYYTMMRVRGRTLEQAIAQARTPSARLSLVRPFFTLCQCVAYAHSRAVIHRDVKPANVMLGQFGEVYLLDWGLARSRGEPGASVRLAPDLTGDIPVPTGTPSYMSPEQARGQDLDERSDVWTLGAVLFEILTGRTPYVGASALEVLRQLASVDPPGVRELAPRAPRELAAVCARALCRDRAQRYRTAEALAADVKAWLDGKLVAAYDYSSLELMRRYLREQRVVLAGALAVAAVFAVTAITGLRHETQERDRARSFARMFLDDVADKLEPVPGVEPLVERLSADALKHFERTGDLERGTRDERLSMARAFRRLGAVQVDLGRLDEGLQALAVSQRLARALLGEEDEPRARLALALALEAAAKLHRARGQQPEQAALLAEALSHVELARPPAGVAREPEALALEARLLGALGEVSLQRGELPAAAARLEAAVSLAREVARARPDSAAAALEQSRLLALRGEVAQAALDDVAALAHFRDALASASEGVELEPASPAQVSNLLRRHLDLGSAQRLAGDHDAALFDFSEGLKLGNRLLQQRPGEPAVLALLVEVETNLGLTSEAWARVRALEGSGGLAQVGPAAVTVAFLAGQHEEALRLAGRPDFERAPTALLYRALAAAMLGRPGDALVAGGPLRDQVARADWVEAGVARAATGPGEGPAAVRAFALEYDAAISAERAPGHDRAAEHARVERAFAALLERLEAMLGKER